MLCNFCTTFWSYRLLSIFPPWLSKHTVLEKVLKRQASIRSYSDKDGLLELHKVKFYKKKHLWFMHFSSQWKIESCFLRICLYFEISLWQLRACMEGSFSGALPLPVSEPLGRWHSISVLWFICKCAKSQSLSPRVLLWGLNKTVLNGPWHVTCSVSYDNRGNCWWIWMAVFTRLSYMVIPS